MAFCESRNTYLSWANCILSEQGLSVRGIEDLQKGKALCQIIDILCPNARLINKAEQFQNFTSDEYFRLVIEFLQKAGVRVTIQTEDVNSGDIKALLDLLWTIILHCGVHNIDTEVHLRNVRVAKQRLLHWCQTRIPNTELDSRRTLIQSLCKAETFTLLLQTFFPDCVKSTGANAETQLTQLFEHIDRELNISKDIIRSDQIVSKTVDEHTLLIYLSLLIRKHGHLDCHQLSYDRWIECRNSLLTILHPSLAKLHPHIACAGFNRSMHSLTIKFQKTMQAEDNKMLRLSDSDTVQVNRIVSSEGQSGSTHSSFDESRSPRSPRQSPHWSFRVSTHSPCSTTLQSPLKASLPLSAILKNLAEGDNIPKLDRCYIDHKQESTGPSFAILSSKTQPSPVRYAKSFDAPNHNSDMKTRDTDYLSIPNRHQSDISNHSEETSEWMSSDNESQENVPNQKWGSNTEHYDLNERLIAQSITRKIDELFEQANGDFDSVDHHYSEAHRGTDHVDARLGYYSPGVSVHRNVYENNAGPVLAPIGQGLPLVMIPHVPYGQIYPPVMNQNNPQYLNGTSSALCSDMYGFTAPKTVSPHFSGLHHIDRHGGNPRQSDDQTRVEPASPHLQDIAVPATSVQSDDATLTKIQQLRDKLSVGLTNSDDVVIKDPVIVPSASREAIDSGNNVIRPSIEQSVKQVAENNQVILALKDELEMLKTKVNSLESSGSNDRSDISVNHESISGNVNNNNNNNNDDCNYNSNNNNYQDATTVPLIVDGEADSRKWNFEKAAHVPNLSPQSYSSKESTLGHYLTHRRSASTDGIPTQNVPSIVLPVNSSNTVGNADGLNRSFMQGKRCSSLQNLSQASQVKPIHVLSQNDLIIKPPRKKNFNVGGYSSPVKNVTQEIWGYIADDLLFPEPNRQKKWRELTNAKYHMTDSEIIELKQGLASAIIENEILQSKVDNASRDATSKIEKMSKDLEEATLSLSQTQIENDELRATCTRDQNQIETLDMQVSRLQGSLDHAVSERSRLETELNGVSVLLDDSAKVEPDLRHLEHENQVLRKKIHIVTDEESKLRQELKTVKESQTKSRYAVKELTSALTEIKGDNSILQEELGTVQSQQKIMDHTAELLARTAEIDDYYRAQREAKSQSFTKHSSPIKLSRYPSVDEYPLNSTSDSLSDSLHNTDTYHIKTSTPYTDSRRDPLASPTKSLSASLRNEIPLMTSSPSCTGHYGMIVRHPSSSLDRNHHITTPKAHQSFNYEAISPAVSTLYNEIYPHRRSKRRHIPLRDYDRLSNFSMDETGLHRANGWTAVGKLNFSDIDLSDSLVERSSQLSNDDESARLVEHQEDEPPFHANYEQHNINNTDPLDSSLTELAGYTAQHNAKNERQQQYSGGYRNANLDERVEPHRPPYERSRSVSLNRDIDSYPDSSLTEDRYNTSMNNYSASRQNNGRRKSILKTSSSEQDLYQMNGIRSPFRDSIRSPSPNVTFKTPLTVSRDISPDDLNSHIYIRPRRIESNVQANNKYYKPVASRATSSSNTRNSKSHLRNIDSKLNSIPDVPIFCKSSNTWQSQEYPDTQEVPLFSKNKNTNYSSAISDSTSYQFSQPMRPLQNGYKSWIADSHYSPTERPLFAKPVKRNGLNEKTLYGSKIDNVKFGGKLAESCVNCHSFTKDVHETKRPITMFEIYSGTAPPLTDEQRRYADHLITKYTHYR